MRRLLVTAALPYANGPIHLGHLVEYLQTDIWTRFQRLRGNDCLYICADDTHGTPVMLHAQELGITPDELVAKMQAEHQADFEGFHIGFDNYYSTNSDENRQFAEEIYLKHRDAGHIDRRDVRQAYCPHDKMFLPDRFIRGTCPKCGAEDQYGDSCENCNSAYSPVDLVGAKCAVCGTAPVEKSSEHLFFRLQDFEQFLSEWIHSGRLQPDITKKLEEWFKEGLRDWDISRDAPYFGFEIPGEMGKFFYVWLDAPMGYMASTLDYCRRTGRDFDEYWRGEDTEVVHFIGKDIVYFHTLFWPAVLHGAGFRTPSNVWVHGFLTVDGAKMSKSRGTFIMARTYLEHLDPQFLRYYYAYKLNARVEDIDLNFEDFANRVNSDLVGKVVNLASRTARFVGKNCGGRLSESYPEDGGLLEQYIAAGDEIAAQYEARDFNKAMRSIMALAEKGNQFVESNAPWTLAKEEGKTEELRDVCTVALNLFRVLVLYLKPVLPKLAEDVERFLKIEALSWGDLSKPLTGQEIGSFKHLMQRVDPKKIAKMVEATKKTVAKKKRAAKEESKVISIDDFSKVELRIARIESAEHVEGADKLLHLALDLGDQGKRQVFAGIKAAYDPTTLPGRLVVCVANLAPRKMKFGVSEGMVLASGPGGTDIYLLSPDSGATPGQLVK